MAGLGGLVVWLTLWAGGYTAWFVRHLRRYRSEGGRPVGLLVARRYVSGLALIVSLAAVLALWAAIVGVAVQAWRRG